MFSKEITTSEALRHTTESAAEIITEDGFVGVVTIQSSPSDVEGSGTPDSMTDGMTTFAPTGLPRTETSMVKDVSETVPQEATSKVSPEELGSGEIAPTAPAKIVITDKVATTVFTDKLVTSETMSRSTVSARDIVTEEGFIGVVTTESSPTAIEGSQSPDTMTDSKTTVSQRSLHTTQTPVVKDVTETIPPESTSLISPEELGSGEVTPTAPAHAIVTDEVATTMFTKGMTKSEVLTLSTKSLAEIITEGGFVGVVTTQSSPSDVEGSGTPDTTKEGMKMIAPTRLPSTQPSVVKEVSETVPPEATSRLSPEELGSGEITPTAPAKIIITDEMATTVFTDKMVTSESLSRTSVSATEIVTEEGVIGVVTTESSSTAVEGSLSPDTKTDRKTTVAQTSLPATQPPFVKKITETIPPESTSSISPEELGSGEVTPTAPAHAIVTDEVATTMFSKEITTSEALRRTTESAAEIITEDGFVGVVTTQSSPSDVEGSGTPDTMTDGMTTVALTSLPTTETSMVKDESETVPQEATSRVSPEELGSGEIAPTAPAKIVITDEVATRVFTNKSVTSETLSRTTVSPTDIATEEGFIGVVTTDPSLTTVEGSLSPDTMTYRKTKVAQTSLPTTQPPLVKEITETIPPESTSLISPEELGSGEVTPTAPAHAIVTDEVATTMFTKEMTKSESLRRTKESAAEIITEDGFIREITTQSSLRAVAGSGTPDTTKERMKTVAPTSLPTTQPSIVTEVSETVPPEATSRLSPEELGSGEITPTAPAKIIITDEMATTVFTDKMVTSESLSRSSVSATDIVTEEGFIGVVTTESSPTVVEGSLSPDTMTDRKTTVSQRSLPTTQFPVVKNITETMPAKSTSRVSPEELGSGEVTPTAPAHVIVTDDVATTVFTKEMTTSEALTLSTETAADIITEDGFIGVVTTQSSPRTVAGSGTPDTTKERMKTAAPTSLPTTQPSIVTEVSETVPPEATSRLSPEELGSGEITPTAPAKIIITDEMATTVFTDKMVTSESLSRTSVSATEIVTEEGFMGVVTTESSPIAVKGYLPPDTMTDRKTTVAQTSLPTTQPANPSKQKLSSAQTMSQIMETDSPISASSKRTTKTPAKHLSTSIATEDEGSGDMTTATPQPAIVTDILLTTEKSKDLTTPKTVSHTIPITAEGFMKVSTSKIGSITPPTTTKKSVVDGSKMTDTTTEAIVKDISTTTGMKQTISSSSTAPISTTMSSDDVTATEGSGADAEIKVTFPATRQPSPKDLASDRVDQENTYFTTMASPLTTKTITVDTTSEKTLLLTHRLSPMPVDDKDGDKPLNVTMGKENGTSTTVISRTTKGSFHDITTQMVTERPSDIQKTTLSFSPTTILESSGSMEPKGTDGMSGGFGTTTVPVDSSLTTTVDTSISSQKTTTQIPDMSGGFETSSAPSEIITLTRFKNFSEMTTAEKILLLTHKLSPLPVETLSETPGQTTEMFTTEASGGNKELSGNEIVTPKSTTMVPTDDFFTTKNIATTLKATAPVVTQDQSTQRPKDKTGADVTTPKIVEVITDSTEAAHVDETDETVMKATAAYPFGLSSQTVPEEDIGTTPVTEKADPLTTIETTKTSGGSLASKIVTVPDKSTVSTLKIKSPSQTTSRPVLLTTEEASGAPLEVTDNIGFITRTIPAEESVQKTTASSVNEDLDVTTPIFTTTHTTTIKKVTPKLPQKIYTTDKLTERITVLDQHKTTTVPFEGSGDESQKPQTQSTTPSVTDDGGAQKTVGTTDQGIATDGASKPTLSHEAISTTDKMVRPVSTSTTPTEESSYKTVSKPGLEISTHFESTKLPNTSTRKAPVTTDHGFVTPPPAPPPPPSVTGSLTSTPPTTTLIDLVTSRVTTTLVTSGAPETPRQPQKIMQTTNAPEVETSGDGLDLSEGTSGDGAEYVERTQTSASMKTSELPTTTFTVTKSPDVKVTTKAPPTGFRVTLMDILTRTLKPVDSLTESFLTVRSSFPDVEESGDGELVTPERTGPLKTTVAKTQRPLSTVAKLLMGNITTERQISTTPASDDAKTTSLIDILTRGSIGVKMATESTQLTDKGM